MSFHSKQVGGSIHVIQAFTYADATARGAATGFTPDDVGKVAKQSDNNSFWVLQDDSPVTWGRLDGGGGGGTAGVNLVSLDSTWSPSNQDNVDAESSIGAWAAYKDAAAAIPVDMTGGSPTVAISRTTTVGEVLNGAASFKIVKDAANRQGEGVSVSGYVPLGYRVANIAVKVPFKVISGSLVQGDLKWYVYDITNSVVITPHNNSVIGTQGVLECSLPLGTTTAQIRVGFHFASTSTTAVTLSFDDVFVGPDEVTFGLAGSDWLSDKVFAPSASFGTVSNSYYLSRRVGDSLEVQGYFTSTSPTGSVAYIQLPTGLSIDPSKQGTAQVQSCGVWYNVTASGPVYSSNAGVVFVDGSNWDRVFLTSAVSSSAFTKEVANNVVNSGAVLRFNLILPISGWSANVTMASSSTFKVSSFLANGTRVTGSAPTLLGQYRSYLRNAGANSYTETNGTPTNPPSVSNGIRLDTASTFSSADPTGSPSKYEIFVGKNKNISYQWYLNTGRTGFIDTTFSSNASLTYNIGVATLYDPTTGIVSVYQAVPFGNGSNLLGLDTAGSGVFTGYFDIVVSENALAVGSQKPRSHIWVSAGNGHGSTNTKIRRFSNLIESTGNAISYVDDASNGASFTIMEDGLYSMMYLDLGPSNMAFGVSVDSTQLTTDISSITNVNRLGVNAVPTTVRANLTIMPTFLRAGQVIRPHDDGTGNDTGDNFSYFKIVKVSD